MVKMLTRSTDRSSNQSIRELFDNILILFQSEEPNFEAEGI
jgi:hypothetical protein